MTATTSRNIKPIQEYCHRKQLSLCFGLEEYTQDIVFWIKNEEDTSYYISLQELKAVHGK